MMNQELQRTGMDDVQGESAGGTQNAPIHLWLVDDNKTLRESLAELLERRQFKCTGSFASANAALSALASKIGPDVILLDIQMGQENGLDAVRPIKSLSRSTRVIMLTTFYDRESHSRAMHDGASGFLLKRYPVEEIMDYIQRARREPLTSPKPRCKSTPALPSKEATAKPRQRSPIIEQCLGFFRNRRN
jgi:DNA-binding NarL/FixJ family response regulator